MKINEIANNLGQLGNLDNNSARLREGQVGAENLGQSSSNSGAKVEISNTSVEIGKAAEKMDVVPEERAKRLAELKTLVRDDMYNISSERVAERIVNDSLFSLIEP